MKVGQLVPHVSLRVQFSLRHHKFVPVEPGCYVLTTFEGDVLYVGLTDDLHRRFWEHRDTKEKCEPTAQGMAFWFYYLGCEIKHLERIERTWLNIHVEFHGERPILNKCDSPVR